MRRRLCGASAACLALLLAGPARAATPSSTLTVFAAASLTDAFSEIGRLLERDRRGLEVRFDFGGSNTLALQIEGGAAADVFASADAAWMERLGKGGLLASPPRIFARNRLVLVVPRANPGRIRGPADLARPGIKLVLAAEAVPAGRYARAALRNLARLPECGPDFPRRALANLVSEEENVRAVVGKLQLGEADAGFCYRSDVAGPAARFLRSIEIPDSLGVVADYPIAALSGARDPAAARAFLRLVESPEGRRILAKAGFLPAAP